MGARMRMVLLADRAPRHGRLARSCAPRENWKALGHGVRFLAVILNGCLKLVRLRPLSTTVFSFSPTKQGALARLRFRLRGNVVLSGSANCEILFLQSISSAR